MKFHRSALYFVGMLPPEPIFSQIENFKQIIATQFGSKTCLKAPAHITLIPPFRFSDEALVIECLKLFKWNKPIPILLTGYGWFRKSVLFVRPESCEPLMALHQQICQHFGSILHLRLNEQNKHNFTPHITIGNRDWTEKQFSMARKFFTENMPIYESCVLSEISLLKHTEGKWQIISKQCCLAT